MNDFTKISTKCQSLRRENMKISVENERKLVNEILINIGVQENHAKIITEATLDSDLKGFT